MHNNDIVRRLQYIFNINSKDMMTIFKLGGLVLDKQTYLAIMAKPDQDSARDAQLSRHDLEKFMNGLIISQRGYKTNPDGSIVAPDYSMQRDNDINNVVIKKIKIAMAYTTEDLLGFWAAADFKVTKGEVGAMLRRKSHPKYLVVGDQFMRKLLMGMANSLRG
ncbi:DUF1456 family protein [Weissella paramesenteroides]|uniref:DUF1456 family protein n=1 Tax=Weissella paramesenteroides TaxID=1249 RepID=UPI00103DF802|nr:DUF1456 family protein [Weissella paramesenteroides]MCM6765327.1 DUF1456 family protein [Weissella paramesenteroides]MCM6766698.1 DUF1456 family protein [Weissella paramesenteroides]MCM6769119.1 DUF1456 family protein [Weissella paramesenteroides]MCM6771538.1 DUF1456 family protein [Weissella paramesenteroides]MCM6779369.1 DUF1456 family protein [Weissella paramesenteroides]